MKNKLWIFGDSFSAGFSKGPTDDSTLAKYAQLKGYEPKNYSNILSEYFDLTLMNKAIHGADNYTIFQTFCDNSYYINDGDFLIFGWSHCDRFRIAHTVKNDWIIISSQHTKGYEDFISETTCIEMLSNRTNITYVEEVNSWIRLIRNCYKNNTILHWSWCDNSQPNTLLIDKCQTIYEDTNGNIKDPHYSEKGQQELANIIIQKIQKK